MEPKLILPSPEKQGNVTIEQIEALLDKEYLQVGLADKALVKLKSLLDCLRETK